jgi:hypothetical protein
MREERRDERREKREERDERSGEMKRKLSEDRERGQEREKTNRAHSIIQKQSIADTHTSTHWHCYLFQRLQMHHAFGEFRVLRANLGAPLVLVQLQLRRMRNMGRGEGQKGVG